MEIINKNSLQNKQIEEYDNDVDDLEIPILITKKANKLKSLDFANRQSFLFNNFKDIDRKENIEINNKSSVAIIKSENNSLKPFKEIDSTNNNNTNDEKQNLKLNSVSSSNEKNEQKESVTTKKSRSLQNDNNYRRLNMKRLQFKGSNKLKGSKFKRKQWVRNKMKIEAEARYGYKIENSDEECEKSGSNQNHNIILANAHSHRNIGLDYDLEDSDENGSNDEESSQDNEQQVEDEYDSDDMSNEAVFSRLNKK